MRRNAQLVAAALIALLHLYVGCRLLPALAWPGWATTAGVFYLVLSAALMPAPLLVRLTRLSERGADTLAWIGYLFMGAFSSLFVFTLLRDVLMVGWLTAEWLRPGTFNVLSLRHDSAEIVVALAAAVSLVGLFNARRTARVVDVELPLAGLPAALHGFTIVQLSDVHVGPTIKRGYLAAIVRRVNALGADLVALTGDITDAHVDRIRRHVTPLAELQARHGAYYVTGNHEYYHGDVDHWLDEARRLGLRVLLNENVVVDHDGAQLLVGGVTDYNGHHFGESHRSDPAAAVRSESAAAVKLLLAHQPLSMKAAAEAGFDVQLSGHTHGGQIWPWNLFVPMQQPIVAGLHRVGKLWVYVSRGTGYWGPPLRFGAPSEITRLKLVPAAG
ncbi:metallophosphoesterase [Solimonas marina]|uniref:Metallophosphoesterase n=1 Tax=Solimonas marina TaxID=2714601 RepID=A0A970B6W4_9GAMM|nr:metallophosphoesterase [Solimonas marina]NKF23030.1 metallophosphoesterase [Solimonas marina]